MKNSGHRIKTLRELEAILALHKDEIRDKYKVKAIGIFGSYARGEQRKRSDVDILVDFYAPVGWEFVDLADYLEGILNTKVDLVTPRALRKHFKDRVLKEMVSI